MEVLLHHFEKAIDYQKDLSIQISILDSIAEKKDEGVISKFLTLI